MPQPIKAFLEDCIARRKGHPKENANPPLPELEYIDWLIQKVRIDDRTMRRWRNGEHNLQPGKATALLQTLGYESASPDFTQTLALITGQTQAPAHSQAGIEPVASHWPDDGVDAQRFLTGWRSARQRAFDALQDPDAQPLLLALHQACRLRGCADVAVDIGRFSALTKPAPPADPDQAPPWVRVISALDLVRKQEQRSKTLLTGNQRQACQTAALHLFVFTLYEGVASDYPVVDRTAGTPCMHVQSASALEAALCLEMVLGQPLEFDLAVSAQAREQVRALWYLTEDDMPGIFPGRTTEIHALPHETLVDSHVQHILNLSEHDDARRRDAPGQDRQAPSGLAHLKAQQRLRQQRGLPRMRMSVDLQHPWASQRLAIADTLAKNAGVPFVTHHPDQAEPPVAGASTTLPVPPADGWEAAPDELVRQFLLAQEAIGAPFASPTPA